jgi:hypothetical protein
MMTMDRSKSDQIWSTRLYAQSQLLSSARLLASMLGLDYSRVRFEDTGDKMIVSIESLDVHGYSVSVILSSKSNADRIIIYNLLAYVETKEALIINCFLNLSSRVNVFADWLDKQAAILSELSNEKMRKSRQRYYNEM